MGTKTPPICRQWLQIMRSNEVQRWHPRLQAIYIKLWSNTHTNARYNSIFQFNSIILLHYNILHSQTESLTHLMAIPSINWPLPLIRSNLTLHTMSLKVTAYMINFNKHRLNKTLPHLHWCILIVYDLAHYTTTTYLSYGKQISSKLKYIIHWKNVLFDLLL